MYEDEFTREIEAEFNIEEAEVKEMVKNATKKSRINVPYHVRTRICRAIVLIHNCARYYEGMAILCALCGWKPRALENEFDPPEERKRTKDNMNAWVRSITAN
jgi:hypothetical protein